MATAKKNVTDPLEFPAPPSLPATRWDELTHDRAVAAYEVALAEANADAGRMRTLLWMFGVPGRPISSGPSAGVEFKA